MKKNIGFWSSSNHLNTKIIPSIKNNINIIPYKLLTSKKKQFKLFVRVLALRDTKKNACTDSSLYNVSDSFVLVPL